MSCWDHPTQAVLLGYPLISLDIRSIFAYDPAMLISKFNMRDRHGKLGSIFSIATLFFSVQISGQKTQGSPALSPASPQAVCAYIAGRMTTILPQQPTLCAAKQDQAPGYYSIDIFSPQNVLEGGARRAWASALFQTLEELIEDKSLNGACDLKPICSVNIFDAYMAQHNLRYRTFLFKDLIPPALTKFSEHWYESWWRQIFTLKESDIRGSKENATQLGKRACEDYIVALQKTTHSIKSAHSQENSLVKEGGTVLGTVGQAGDR